MADEDVNNCEQLPPPHTESAGLSNNINIMINPNTRNQQKKRKCNRFHKYLLAKTVVEIVNEIPWDIDGDITYQMKSDADFWINDTNDGRWWHTTDSKCKRFTDVVKESLPPAMGPMYVTTMNAPNGSKKKLGIE